VEILRQRFPEITFVHALTEEVGIRAIGDAEIAFSSSLTAAMAARAERLKWVHSTASAVGNLPLGMLSERRVIVTNSRGIQAVPIAEHVMAGLLALSRRLDVTLRAQLERRWIQNDLDGDRWPRRLHGRRMTIFGLGTIGMEVARRAAAFGVRVRGVRRRNDQPLPDFVERVFGPDQLDEALRSSDILVVSAPFLPETDRRIASEQLALLQRGAVVVNVARGQIVDEAALIAALQSGQLGGAVLDVFDREPLDTSSPLWTLSNVIVTPHCAGFREDHWDDVIDLFSENLRRFQSGRPLLNTVDLQTGY
jgi:phosphoglycerate dehydrogenase-like enzyme